MEHSSDPFALERILEPLTKQLGKVAAQNLLDFRVDAETLARIDALSEACSQGALTPEEKIEYETFVRTIDLITILQLQAKALLDSSPAA